MINIKFSHPYKDWPFVRQTPSALGIWEDCQYFINCDVDECDYWVVYEGLSQPEVTKCNVKNILLICGEPSTVKNYDPKFIQQFAVILTPRHDIRHNNIIKSHPLTPWRVGVDQGSYQKSMLSKSYDELMLITDYNKSELISVISSDLKISDGHIKRNLFVSNIVDRFGMQIHYYGRGIRDIPDKWDAISKYKYHIVIENSVNEDYWTEKLADCYLGGAYPFYHGAPNIYDYFPKNSLTQINLNDIEESIKIIKADIENNTYDKSIDHINLSKNLVLNKYNIFAEISRSVSSISSNCKTKQIITLYPENYVSEINKITQKIFNSFSYRVIKPLKELTGFDKS